MKGLAWLEILYYDFTEFGRRMVKERKIIDTRGYHSPIPLAMASRGMHGMAEGEIVSILFDDDAFQMDLRGWCRETGNEFIEGAIHGAYSEALVRRGSGFKTESLMERVKFIAMGVRLHFTRFIVRILPWGRISYLLTFVSIPEGVRADGWLEERGVRGYTVLPVPRDITSHCGLVLGFRKRSPAIRAFNLLRENGYAVEDIYLVDGGLSRRIDTR